MRKYLFFLIPITLFWGCDENADRNQAFIKGRDALKQKEYQTALTQLEMAVSFDSTFAEAWNNLGITYFELEEYKKASNAYEKAIQLDSCLQDAYQNKANLLFHFNKNEEAIGALNVGLNCNQENLTLLLNRATLLQMEGKFDLAMQDLRAYQKIVPKDDILFTNIGYCFYELGQYDSAFHYSVIALELNEKRDEAANNLGMISLKTDKKEDALKFFKDAVKLKPHNTLYRKNVAETAFALNEMETACQNAKMAQYYGKENQFDNLVEKTCSDQK